MSRPWPFCPVIALAVTLGAAAEARADDAAARVGFREEPGTLVILVGDAPVATYVYRDPAITRPYFAHVRTPGGVQVTRNHPPVAGSDPVDHAALHPGLWLAFGDLSGADSWRNKAAVAHDRFLGPPVASGGRGAFTVRNLYKSADGGATLCAEVCRYQVVPRPSGYLLTADSEFTAGPAGLTFGDQEEMGFGLRVATPLSVKSGGRILGSAGARDERGVRGTATAWADYGGPAPGGFAGVTLMQSPRNLRPGWFHARDYGLLVANPFGRKALTKGEEGRHAVDPGGRLRLGFAVFVHASPTADVADPAAAYREYAALDAADAAYDAVAGKRADDVVAVLALDDPVRASRVRAAVASEYRALRDLHDARDAAAKAAGTPGRADAERARASAASAALNAAFLEALSADLTPAQVDAVKDKITYNKLRVTYQGYLDMLPALTPAQKQTVLSMLTDARDQAVYAGSSEEKSEVFGKYKGRVNNYLSAQGYDLKKASREWAERRKRQGK